MEVSVNNGVKCVELSVGNATRVIINTTDGNQVTLSETVVVVVEPNNLWVITKDRRRQVRTIDVSFDGILLCGLDTDRSVVQNNVSGGVGNKVSSEQSEGDILCLIFGPETTVLRHKQRTQRRLFNHSQFSSELVLTQLGSPDGVVQ